jgi:hypothetical protein
MTLEQFKYLSTEVQDYILSRKAVLIDVIEDGEGCYTLFQLDSFYLEIFTSRIGELTTCSICFFDDPDLLEPYLKRIDIAEVEDLLNNI